MSEQEKTPRSFEEIYDDLCKHFGVKTLGIEVGEVGQPIGTDEKPYELAYYGNHEQVVVTYRQDIWAGFVEAYDSYADTWDASQRFLAEKENIPIFKEINDASV